MALEIRSDVRIRLLDVLRGLHGWRDRLRHISPAWYIPPVALVIIPFGASFMRTTTGYTREFVTIVSYLGWRIGFFPYLVLYAVVTLHLR